MTRKKHFRFLNMGARGKKASFFALASLLLFLEGGIGGDKDFFNVATSASAATSRGPEGLADLVDQVVDSVVNISVTQSLPEAQRQGGNPLFEGTPFDEFLEDLMRRRPGPWGGEGEERRRPRSSSLGSGFVIDPSGIVITNNHVIGDSTDITVIFSDGQKLKAEIVGRDSKIDVAVLRVKGDKPFKAVKFGDSDKARVGDWVLAVGNPFGLGGTVTAGIVSARNRNIDSSPYDNYIQTDAAINRGNSGGPLFNMNGEVIGMNTAILSPSGGSVGIGFANPSNTISHIVDQIRQFGEARRGWLGVRIQNIDETLADSLNLGKVRGALVASVDSRGPAKSSSLKTGDVIIKFNGKPIQESRDLTNFVAATPVGTESVVTYLHDGKEMETKVVLGRLENNETLANSSGEDSQQGSSLLEKNSSGEKILGLNLVALNPKYRLRWNLKEDARGVLVLKVDPNSEAAEKRINAGDLIIEINQEVMVTPADIVKKVNEARAAKRKALLLLIANARGDVHFVALELK